jgi:hypothetical protein
MLIILKRTSQEQLEHILDDLHGAGFKPFGDGGRCNDGYLLAPEDEAKRIVEFLRAHEIDAMTLS